ncbi:MAG: PqqD family peptide modification chaperone [Gemmatimonas sp.]|nr:PqqD family peptide modification chaperone [Gemmatimonas sp.]
MIPMSGSETRPRLPRPHPGVIFNTLSDGAVLLHASSEIYFGLNRVGSRVWQLLPPECDSFEELCRQLSQEYPEVGVDQLSADVQELLESLRAHQLVVNP